MTYHIRHRWISVRYFEMIRSDVIYRLAIKYIRKYDSAERGEMMAVDTMKLTMTMISTVARYTERSLDEAFEHLIKDGDVQCAETVQILMGVNEDGSPRHR